MTVIEFAKKIVTFVAKNVESESALLFPNPRYKLDAKRLLDHIVQEAGVSAEVIDDWIEEVTND